MQRKQNRGLAQVAATAMRPTNLTTSIVSLEIVLGAIMTFGGIALTFFATEKILGIVHTGLGLLAFPIAYAFWTSRSRAWNAILTLNVASIAYSTFSEIIAANLS